MTQERKVQNAVRPAELTRQEQDLSVRIGRILEIGQSLGLDPFPISFELLSASHLYELGAYGLPGRFSHWTFGKAYHAMKTRYDYGLEKMYELVINTNPAYAGLLEGNSSAANLMVAAHVMAHVDFFRHNLYFEHTRRDTDAAANRAARMRTYEFEHSPQAVEELLDIALALERHIDPQSLRFRRKTQEEYEKERLHPKPPKREGEYDDVLELVSSGPREIPRPAPRKVPPEPEQDLLLFFMQHGELEDWQKDILGMVREEAYYFYPQVMTKVMNEGWAALMHRRIMRAAGEEGILTPQEVLEWMHLDAAVVAPHARFVNPYQLGRILFERVDELHEGVVSDKLPKFDFLGRPIDYSSYRSRDDHDIFSVRSMNYDGSFLRNHLTDDLIEEHDLYLYALDSGEWKITEKDPALVREYLIELFTTGNIPFIQVEDADYRRKRGLYMRHIRGKYPQWSLDISYMEKVLSGIAQKLWKRPVHLETEIDGARVLFTCDDAGKISKSTP